MEEMTTENSTNHAKELLISTIKVKLNLLGPVGTILNEIFFGYGERLKANRIDELLKKIQLKIKKLEDKSIDFEKLQANPDMHDLSLEVFKNAIKTSSDLKISLLANFLIEKIITQEELNHDKNLLMLRIIDNLTVTHLSIFIFLNENVDNYKGLNNFHELYDDYSAKHSEVSLEKSLFRAFVKDIENMTLCRFSKNVNEYGSTGGYMESEDSSIVPGLIITPLGKELIDLIPLI